MVFLLQVQNVQPHQQVDSKQLLHMGCIQNKYQNSNHLQRVQQELHKQQKQTANLQEKSSDHTHELPKLINDKRLLEHETSSNLYKKLVSYQETSGQDLSKYILELKDINNRERLHVKNVIDKDGNFHNDDIISGITNNLDDSLRTFKHNLKVHINSIPVVPKRKEQQKGKGSLLKTLKEKKEKRQQQQTARRQQEMSELALLQKKLDDLKKDPSNLDPATAINEEISGTIPNNVKAETEIKKEEKDILDGVEKRLGFRPKIYKHGDNIPSPKTELKETPTKPKRSSLSENIASGRSKLVPVSPIKKEPRKSRRNSILDSLMEKLL